MSDIKKNVNPFRSVNENKPLTVGNTYGERRAKQSVTQNKIEKPATIRELDRFEEKQHRDASYFDSNASFKMGIGASTVAGARKYFNRVEQGKKPQARNNDATVRKPRDVALLDFLDEVSEPS